MAGLGISLPPELLKDIPTHQLSLLAQKDDDFETFFSQLDLEKMREIQRKREILNNKNRELSIQNTEQRPAFDEKKEKLTNSCLVAAEMKDTYEKKYGQLKTMAGSTDRASLHKELQQAMKTAEKDSEDLVDNYLDGTSQMPCDEFINQFLSHRSSYWSRRVKSEKMEVIMKQPLPYPSQSNQPIYATVGGGGGVQHPYSTSPMQSIPPYPPSSGTNEAPPPNYGSFSGSNPTQSYNRAPLLPSASMPVPSQQPHSYNSSAAPPYMGKRNSCPAEQPSLRQGGYPQASYRPSPQNYSQPPPPPQGSYRPPPGPPHGGIAPPAVGQSYPIYQSRPYYPNNQYGGYPPRR